MGKGLMMVKDNGLSGTIISARLNALGLLCPLPLIRLQAQFEPMAPGAILELLADDPGLEDDLPAWCQQTGHKLLQFEPCPQGWRARIQKR